LWILTKRKVLKEKHIKELGSVMNVVQKLLNYHLNHRKADPFIAKTVGEKKEIKEEDKTKIVLNNKKNRKGKYFLFFV